MDRWPRWFPRRELQTTTRPWFGQWVPRTVSHLGSIDPTICSSLAAPAQPGRRIRRPADLLSGDSRCARHPRAVVTFARRHQLPGDAGNLVGERHGREFWRLALQHGKQPRRRTATATPNLLDHCGRSRHQQPAQDLVAGASDLAEPGLAGSGMVLRCQPEPSRKVPAGGERARIGRLHHHPPPTPPPHPPNPPHPPPPPPPPTPPHHPPPPPPH